MPQSRFQEAVESTERAVDLNPLDPVLCGGATFAYAAIGNYALRRVSMNQESKSTLTIRWCMAG
jgi:hypothetical protein